MNAFGLDLSITAPGLCWGNRNTDMATLNHAALGITGDRRYNATRDNIRHILRHYSIDLAVLEGPAWAANLMFQFGMVHYAARGVLMDFGIPYVTVQPTTLKQYATGSGAADKADMIAAVTAAVGTVPGDDNQADSWWLREMGLAALGHPTVELTDERRGILAGIRDWPRIVNRWDFYAEDRKAGDKVCGDGYVVFKNAGRWVHAFGLGVCEKPDKKPRTRKVN